MGDVPQSRLSLFGTTQDVRNALVGVETCIRAGSIAGMGETSFFLGCGFMAEGTRRDCAPKISDGCGTVATDDGVAMDTFRISNLQDVRAREHDSHTGMF